MGKCTGKSAGHDGLYAEHLIYGPEKLYYFLCILFNACIAHGYVPCNMLKCIMVPLIKNKNSSIMDKSNYGPIALSTVLSKLFEIIILHKLKEYISTTDNQLVLKREWELILQPLLQKKPLLVTPLAVAVS